MCYGIFPKMTKYYSGKVCFILKWDICCTSDLNSQQHTYLMNRTYTVLYPVHIILVVSDILLLLLGIMLDTQLCFSFNLLLHECLRELNTLLLLGTNSTYKNPTHKKIILFPPILFTWCNWSLHTISFNKINVFPIRKCSNRNP